MIPGYKICGRDCVANNYPNPNYPTRNLHYLKDWLDDGLVGIHGFREF